MSQERIIWRLRLLACSLALAALAFWQRPGLIAPGRDVGLTLNVEASLNAIWRGWHLDNFGHVETAAEQPPLLMIAFYGAMDAAQVPSWVAQRAWWSIVLATAFLGLVRLTGELGVRSQVARVVAGLGFALAPTALTSLAVDSPLAWAAAISPWVVAPIIRALRGGNIRRNAAASSLAFAAAGQGVLVIPLLIPAACLLILVSGWQGGLAARGRFAAWWTAAVVAATAWWWAPALATIQFRTPVEDWSVPASATTANASLVNAFRGAADWQAYIAVGGEPALPAGWNLASNALPIVASAAIAGLGLAGLARRGVPFRPALLMCVAVGLVAITIGHEAASIASPLADRWQRLLDSMPPEYRDVAFIDVVVRLPLAVGLAYLVSVARWEPWADRTVRLIAAGLAGITILGTAAPALTDDLARRSYEAVPEHWREVGGWLNENAASGRALIVPGATAAVYQWGSPGGEVVGALTNVPWATREPAPPSSAGNLRLLDAIEQRLATGGGGEAVTGALVRAGITHIVVRNDLNSAASGTPRSLLLYDALNHTPGLQWVASFGEQYGSLNQPGSVGDGGLSPPFSAVDIFAVEGGGTEARVRAYPEAGSLWLSGGPESILAMSDAGILEGRAAFLAADVNDVAPARAVPVITDGNRRRTAWYAMARDNTTEVLRSDERPDVDTLRPYLPITGDESVAVVAGITDVRTSSSSSRPDLSGAFGPEYSPWAAVDGDRETAWLSGGFGFVVDQWIELEFGQPVDVGTVEVSLYDEPPVVAAPTLMRVVTDQGEIEVAVRPDGTRQRLAVPAGPTNRLRLAVADTESGQAGLFGVREIVVPGIEFTRGVRAADLPSDADVQLDGSPAAVFSTSDLQRSACAEYGRWWRCGDAIARHGEEGGTLVREFSLPIGGEYVISGQVKPRPGAALERLVQPSSDQLRVTASSRRFAEPVAGPQAAADGDLGTSWIAAPGDTTPSLRLHLPEERTIDGLELSFAPGLAASQPVRLVLAAGGSSWVADVDAAGSVDFGRTVRARTLSVEITDWATVTDVESTFGTRSPLPPGISEVIIRGAEDLVVPRDESAVIDLPCGSGPAISVDGAEVPTSVRGTAGEIMALRPLELKACANAVPLRAGSHHVRVEPTAQTVPVSLWLMPNSAPRPPSAPPSVVVHSWDDSSRVVAISDRDEATVLVVPENANAGWQAIFNGEVLPSVRHDGWAQAYLIPPGDAGFVVLNFTPAAAHREALVAGLVVLALVIVLAAWPAPSASPQAPQTWQVGRADARAALPIVALCGVAGLVVASRPWPHLAPAALGAWPQVLVLMALSLAMIGWPIRRRTRSMSGDST